MLMLLDDILVLSSLSCKRQRMVLYRVYSDRQSQSSHLDLEVQMRDIFPQGSSQLLYVTEAS